MTDGQTDGRTKATLIVPFPTVRGINICGVARVQFILSLSRLRRCSAAQTLVLDFPILLSLTSAPLYS